MLGIKMGDWWVRSDKDPRWNKSGRAIGTVCGGGPDEMREWIEECKSKYGSVPDDATCGFMKD